MATEEFNAENSAISLLPADAEKILGICVRMMANYAVIWSPERNLVAWSEPGYLEIPLGTWVLFKSQRAERPFECGLIKETASQLEQIQNRRNTKPFRAGIQVEAIFKTYDSYNESFFTANDELLGKILCPKDRYIISEIRDRQTVTVAAAFVENKETISNWIAVGVLDRNLAEPGYRKLNLLPHWINSEVEQHYEKIIPPPAKPLTPKQANAEIGRKIRAENDLKNLQTYGDTKARFPLYQPDEGVETKVAVCLIVHVFENAAIGYNKNLGLCLIQAETFESSDDFKKAAQLGQWVVGIFTKPLRRLPSGNRVELIIYQWMALSNMEAVNAPNGVKTRIVRVHDDGPQSHYFAGTNANVPHRGLYLQVKVDCHFIEPDYLGPMMPSGMRYFRTNFAPRVAVKDCDLHCFTPELFGKSVSTWITFNFIDANHWQFTFDICKWEKRGKVIEKREDYLEIDLRTPLPPKDPNQAEELDEW